MLVFCFYLALQRKVLLAKRYKELKESGRLEKFLVKKRKRNTTRDRKRMPPKQISKYWACVSVCLFVCFSGKTCDIYVYI